MNLEERVQELADKQAISDLINHLCHLIDTFQLERMVEDVYAEDGSDDHGGGPVVGRAAIRAWYEDSTKNIAAIAHNIANLVVDVEGDTATARSNVIAWAWTMANADRGPMRNADYALSVVYHDKLTRYPEGWRIDERVLVANSSKTGIAHVVALGELPGTQRGIHSLSEREPPGGD
jgi:SnoaL-like domain